MVFDKLTLNVIGLCHKKTKEKIRTPFIGVLTEDIEYMSKMWIENDNEKWSKWFVLWLYQI